MKTPDEIKKGLECCITDDDGYAKCSDCPYVGSEEWGCKFGAVERDALEYIQRIEDQFREDAKKTPSWISVNDRLPDSQDTVLIALYGMAFLAFYKGDGKFETLNGILYDAGDDEFDIHYWMPLPKPPKEGQNEV